jgi:hypothetical protein
MGKFNQFVRTGLVDSLRVIGEPASIGGNQFTAAFDDSEMDVTRHIYGDDDEVTTEATCLKSALSNTPRIGETLTRIDHRKTYVITEVQQDVESYRLTMRAKDA